MFTVARRSIQLSVLVIVGFVSTCQVNGGLPPVISVRPSNTTVFRGEAVAMPCSVDTKYGATLDWLKDGANISISSRIRMGSTSGRLYILQTVESDTGWYRCEATNEYGRDTAEAYVKVLGDVPPIITLAPMNTTLHVGQEHLFTCEGKSSPPPSYNWLYNGGDIIDSSILQTKGTLHISSAALYHTGWYTCQVWNTYGAVSAKIYVNVVSDPTIVQSPKPTLGFLGKEAKLVCIASASWKNIKTVWWHDVDRVNEDTRVVYNLRSEKAVTIASLDFKTIQVSDEGHYSCRISNENGADYSQSAMLTVVDPPTIIIGSPEVKVWKRKDARFTCEARGIPLPQVHWSIQGQQINASVLPMMRVTDFSDSIRAKSILEIINVGVKNEGIVQCVAENYVQTATENYQLIIVGEPESPWGVTANMTTAKTVSVSWNEGHQGGDVPYFIVQFKLKDSAEWEKDVADKGQRILYLTGSKDWQNFEVRVIAVNKYGQSLPSKVVQVKGDLKEPSSDNLALVIAGSVGGFAFVLLLIIAFLLYLRFRKPKPVQNIINNVTYSVVGEEARVDIAPTYNHDDGTYASLQNLANDDDDNYTTIPAGKNWEVPRESLRIGKILGAGNFGQVVRAVLTDENNESKTVAVKMLKDGHSEKDLTDFYKELNLMKSIKPHPNVVCLIGCCTRGGNPYIIVEYLPNGNLREFLQANRARERDLYTNLAPFCTTLTSKHLLSFAWQICKGMSYLAGLRLVHRDLAARNVLLSKENYCKISDFGLARDIYQDNLYQRTAMGHLPLRWMAYESVFNGVSTAESDVWSFGILLWEIVTLGGTPYPDFGREELLAGLIQGYRMPKPPHCSDEMYAIMIECWQQNPEDRPTFHELCKTFQRIEEGQQVWVDLSSYQESEYYNMTELEEEKAKSRSTLNKSKGTLNMQQSMEKDKTKTDSSNSLNKSKETLNMQQSKDKDKAKTDSSNSLKMKGIKVELKPADGKKSTKSGTEI